MDSATQLAWIDWLNEAGEYCEENIFPGSRRRRRGENVKSCCDKCLGSIGGSLRVFGAVLAHPVGRVLFGLFV